MTNRVIAALALAAAILPASAADDTSLTHMALCQDSWAEWSKSEPAKFTAFRAHVMDRFSPHDNDPYFVPKVSMSVAGLPVVQAFPQSVGMGVGFSLTVDAAFDTTRKAMEKSLGKILQHCESSEGMKNCELAIAPQRTFMLMAEDNPKNHQTLIGCYYFYEK